MLFLQDMSKSRLQFSAFQALMALFLLLGLSGCGRLGLNGDLDLESGLVRCLMIYRSFIRVEVASSNISGNLELFSKYEGGDYERVQEEFTADTNGKKILFLDEINGHPRKAGRYSFKLVNTLDPSQTIELVQNLVISDLGPCPYSREPYPVTFTLP